MLPFGAVRIGMIRMIGGRAMKVVSLDSVTALHSRLWLFFFSFGDASQIITVAPSDTLCLPYQGTCTPRVILFPCACNQAL